MEREFGVCRLAAVPVIQDADGGKKISELLFGDAYEVLERHTQASRLKIKMNFDGIEGWIDVRHHVAISPEYFEQITQLDFKITTDIVSTILYKKSPLPILMGSVVPISSSELFKMDQQFAFNGEAKSIRQKRDAEFVKGMALKYLHAPASEGGKSPFGICAQGLIQMVFKISGYTLPWTLAQQAECGEPVRSADVILPGDIAFFKDRADNLIHAGIILGDERIIHAFGQVKIDHFNQEGILNLETKVYSHSLALIRRVINP